MRPVLLKIDGQLKLILAAGDSKLFYSRDAQKLKTQQFKTRGYTITYLVIIII